MDNFEYSIQLNDRDWAEFYFVSEECRLVPPALATAEDQLLSDLEEEEAEGKRTPAHQEATRLSPEVQIGRPLAGEDALSGSEEEADLGSAGRLLCRSQRVFLPPKAFPSPFSSLPLNPGPATVPLSVAEEESIRIVDWTMDPETKAGMHIAQEKDSRALRAPFQETPPPSQEHLVQVTPLLVNGTARASGKEEEDVLKTERGAGPIRSLSPNSSQEGSQAKDNGLDGRPEVLEEDGSPEPSLEVNNRGSATSSGKMERQNHGEPRVHLGLATPPEEEFPTRSRGSPGFASHRPKSNGRSEETLATMTWPEVCDYFFSDDLQEPEGPSSREGRSGKTSHGHRSELPALSTPEMYECFFQDEDESSVEEGAWSKTGPSETSLKSDHRWAPSDVLEESTSSLATDPMGFPEAYEHFFAHPPQSQSRQRPNILAVPTSELGKVVRALTSLVGRPVRFLRSRPRRRESWASMMLVSPTLLDGRSTRPENLGVAVLKPERPLQLVLTPRDLCLGFVALASWAVKTSDLRSPDAWKIVLLANFGTLSAIRCFRRQVIMESYPSS